VTSQQGSAATADKPEPIFVFDSWQGKRVQVFADDKSLRGRRDLFHTWTRQIQRSY
jgi:hypothetical protein